MDFLEFKIPSKHPIDFSEYHKGYIFPFCDIDEVSFRKTFLVDRKLVRVQVQADSESSLVVNLTSPDLGSERVRDQVIRWITYIFDLDNSHQPALDRLSELANEINSPAPQGLGFLSVHSADEMLLNALLSQNTTAKFYFKMSENIAKTFGKNLALDNTESWTYPSIIHLNKQKVERLAKCKIGYRIRSLPFIAEFLRNFLEEEFSELSLSEMYKKLVSIKGIGDYSARCFQIYYLKRYEVVFVDSWVRHVMNRLFGTPKKITVRQLEEFCEQKFGSQRALVLDYLLANLPSLE